MTTFTTKRRIGISFSRTNFHYYWNWFAAEDLGDDLELVLLSFEQNNREDFSRCDAFVLTGGVDVSPSLYGAEGGYPNCPDEHQPDRDAFEAAIYFYAQAHRMPLLAICRGMQLVNVLEGGRLLQDLDGGNDCHRKIGEDKSHRVSVLPGTLLHTVADCSEEEINSAHHQAVDPAAIGQNLRVNAVSPGDDFIEGFEFDNKEGKGFFLGVQWHPERMAARLHPLSQRIKEKFLEEVRSQTKTKLAVINPATEEVIAELYQDDAQSIRQKLERLRYAQVAWQGVPLSERVDTIKRFSELLAENAETLSAVLTSEVGKPLQQARAEVGGARSRLAWLASNAGKYLSDEVMTDEQGLQEKIVYEPLGVVCNISAWNYPYLVGVNVFVPALLAGNAVLYKPSEFASLTGLQIEKLLKQAGVPEDVFQVAVGGKEVGEVLLDMPFDGYFFTGSVKTGRYIYNRVAPKMVPCQCELGGKDPLYVADDVDDIKAVAAATADGAFYNNGQSCCAVERIYVHEKIYADYLAAFVAEVKGFKAGLPTEEGVYIGPLTRGEQLRVLEAQIEDSLQRGAKLETGGRRSAQKGYYFEPTVLTNVTNDMQVMREESFGPVIGICKVSSDAEAVRLMNDTDYGLTAGVYSRSEERATSILRQVNTGTGYWNCCDRVSAAVPWSGRKASGFGSTLSHTGLRAFTKPKAFHLKPPL